ncbi:hypothetical protein C8J57DRAFT_1667719 [Mycena rebaudengoi]|nr:hypothetical protein C8J57DRAFT_1667719 [Mycena rebaudengoi]
MAACRVSASQPPSPWIRPFFFLYLSLVYQYTPSSAPCPMPSTFSALFPPPSLPRVRHVVRATPSAARSLTHPCSPIHTHTCPSHPFLPPNYPSLRPSSPYLPACRYVPRLPHPSLTVHYFLSSLPVLYLRALASHPLLHPFFHPLLPSHHRVPCPSSLPRTSPPPPPLHPRPLASSPLPLPTRPRIYHSLASLSIHPLPPHPSSLDLRSSLSPPSFSATPSRVSSTSASHARHSPRLIPFPRSSLPPLPFSPHLTAPLVPPHPSFVDRVVGSWFLAHPLPYFPRLSPYSVDRVVSLGFAARARLIPPSLSYPSLYPAPSRPFRLSPLPSLTPSSSSTAGLRRARHSSRSLLPTKPSIHSFHRSLASPLFTFPLPSIHPLTSSRSLVRRPFFSPSACSLLSGASHAPLALLSFCSLAACHPFFSLPCHSSASLQLHDASIRARLSCPWVLRRAYGCATRGAEGAWNVGVRVVWVRAARERRVDVTHFLCGHLDRLSADVDHAGVSATFRAGVSAT